MQTNYILKEAVLTALAALSIGLHSQAFAIGLGEIEVRSHIGQPLQAKVNVQGISELKDKGCFRIGDDSDGVNAISHANLKLSNIKGDEGVLTITTVEAITEPIVSLSVIAECDSHFRRDYVLLIDPLLTAELDQSSDEERVETVENINSVAKKSATIATQSAQSNNNDQKNIRRKKAADKQTIVKKNAANENIVLNVNKSTSKTAKNYVDASSTISNDVVKNAPKAIKPRLSISGGEAVNNANSISLRMDKQLHFSAETAPEALASNIAVEDEATVLSNRLAHLEQQITSLQQRNNVLEAEKKSAVQTVQHNLPTVEAAKTSLISNLSLNFTWWPYLAGTALLIGGYFAADFWRRRRQSQQLDNNEEIWDVLDANSNDVGYYKELDLNDTLFESKPAAVVAARAKDALNATNFEAVPAPIPFQIEEDQFENNILDHADVFLSHGRTSLAIQLLQNHLQDHPKQSVTIWLFLLDLLAKENLQALYEQTTIECKGHFNIRIGDFSNDEASPKQYLEDFPRLTAGLEQVWGTPAALVFLDDLIYNSRLENRVGFEKSVVEELVLLRSIAQSNVSKADVIHLDEKKMAIKELKEAKLAATKADKLQQLEELTLVAAAKNTTTAPALPEELFEFNLVDYK